ncbi:MAG: efflux transporter periplasmic adaptor subunit, partial [Bosea sp. 32-68-6]
MTRPPSARRALVRRTRPLLPLCGLPLLLALAGCDRAEKAPPQAGRPVQVVKVEASLLTAGVELSGEIQAEKTVSLAFRIAGRIAERPVNVGDRVVPGQVVARLDRTIETNAVAAAEAALEAARGEVVTARSTFERQERLMGQGFTTRPRFDAAQKAQETAQAALENAEAQLEQARDRLGFTDLRADVAGVVTVRSAEPGEVVQPGQPILQIAREDGRDAVFAVPARVLEGKTGDPVVRVVLAEAPGVSAIGRIREIAPQA